MPAMFRADGRAFGFTYAAEDMERARHFVDLTRFRIAVEQGVVVGVAGSFALDLTVPGGAAVPMGGVTWVSVAATHRRQGLLRRLMGSIHDDIEARGEPCAGLTASEGSIYERFGYGIATQLRHIVIETAAARFRPEHVPPRGTVRFIEPDDAKGYVADLWERCRRECPGETSRSSSWWEGVFDDQAKEQDGYTPVLRLAHRDGYAAYRVKSRWHDGHPDHELELIELVAATAEARAALWHTLLNVDLVTTVSSYRVSLDDPLPLLLDNPRAVRTDQLRDCLWLRPRDTSALLRARTYATEDRFVLEVADASAGPPVRWELEGGLAGATATRSRRRPDLVLGQAALGSIFLGGPRPSFLARGGLVEERTPGALGRADLFFSAPRLPFTQNPF